MFAAAACCECDHEFTIERGEEGDPEPSCPQCGSTELDVFVDNEPWRRM